MPREKEKISQIKQTSILVIVVKKEYRSAVKMSVTLTVNQCENATVNVSKLDLYLRH